MNGLRSTPGHQRPVSTSGILAALLVAVLLAYSQRTALPKPPPETPTAHLNPIPEAFQSGKSHIKAVGARFSPDGTVLVVLNAPSSRYSTPFDLSDGISLFDVRTGKMVWQVKGIHVAHIKFSADGTTLACDQTAGPKPDTNGDFEVELRDARTGKALPDRRKFPLKYGLFGGFALSPDGKQIALSDFPRSPVRLLDTVTGEAVRTFGNYREYRRFSGWELDIAFSPDGRYIAARPYNNCPNYGLDCPHLLVFEAATGRVVYANTDPEYLAPSGIFSGISVCFDPAFFVTNERLVFGNSFLDLDGTPPLSPRPMIRDSDMRPGSQGYRLFVGFMDNVTPKKGTQGKPALRALFYASYLADDKDWTEVARFEVWNIETKKRERTVGERKGGDYYSRVLDYSPTARLIARASRQGILTLERL